MKDISEAEQNSNVRNNKALALAKALSSKFGARGRT